MHHTVLVCNFFYIYNIEFFKIMCQYFYDAVPFSLLYFLNCVLHFRSLDQKNLKNKFPKYTLFLP